MNSGTVENLSNSQESPSMLLNRKLTLILQQQRKKPYNGNISKAAN